MTASTEPSPGPARPARTTFHHGDLRRALVQAAEELLTERGAGEVSLRGAAELAGVSSAAPYRHFPDKEALLVAVALKGYRALQDHVRAAPGEAGTRAAVHELVHAYAEFAMDHPQLYRLMMGTGIADRGRYGELTAAHDETCAILIDAVAAAAAHRRMIAPDPVAVAKTLWCTVHGLATLIIDGRIAPRDVTAEVEVSQAILDDGLRPRD